jgi:hypothetical protein
MKGRDGSRGGCGRVEEKRRKGGKSVRKGGKRKHRLHQRNILLTAALNLPPFFTFSVFSFWGSALLSASVDVLQPRELVLLILETDLDSVSVPERMKKDMIERERLCSSWRAR